MPAESTDSGFLNQAKAGSASLPSDAIAALVSSTNASFRPAPFPQARFLIRGEATSRHALGLIPKKRTSSSKRRQEKKVGPWLVQALRNRWESYRERLEECQEAPSEESVHQLRVAIRRLTSQMLLLDCVLSGSKPQRTLRMLKRQLKLLGRLRDHHVQQVFLEHQAAKFPELLVLRSYFKPQKCTVGTEIL